jgi:hypothetical protein
MPRRRPKPANTSQSCKGIQPAERRRDRRHRTPASSQYSVHCSRTNQFGHKKDQTSSRSSSNSPRRQTFAAPALQGIASKGGRSPARPGRHWRGSCKSSTSGPNWPREVGGGRTTRQPGQVRKEAALTRPGGSLSSLLLLEIAAAQPPQWAGSLATRRVVRLKFLDARTSEDPDLTSQKKFPSDCHPYDCIRGQRVERERRFVCKDGRVQ